jgi:hypothetical protein
LTVPGGGRQRRSRGPRDGRNNGWLDGPKLATASVVDGRR